MIQDNGTYRMTARVVGAMYVAGFVVGIGGEMAVKSILSAPNHLSIVSSSAITVAIGALLWLMAVIGDAAHGVLMFPILKHYNNRIAIGYLTFRIIDATFIAIMVLFILVQIPLGSEFMKAGAPITSIFPALSNVVSQTSLYAYDIGMMILGVSGLLLNYLFYKARLIPRPLAIWGLIGYAILFIGMISEVMGSGMGLTSSIPGGLWELFLGFWLIFKGFNKSAFSQPPANS